MNDVVRLIEYRPSEPVALTISQRDNLLQVVPDMRIQPVPGTVGHYTLASGSTVGVAHLDDDLTVEIQPKIGLAPVLFMLSYSLDPRAWRAHSAPLARESSLTEALVPLFARLVADALRPGMLHDYRRTDESLTTIRGRIRVADQLARRTDMPLPVEISYDDFTPDVLENQLLRSATDVLRRMPTRAGSSQSAVFALHQQLNGISPAPLNAAQVPEPRWTRLNDRYRPAVSLARLILDRSGLAARAGEHTARAVLVDMNRLFEDFVRVALRERLRLSPTDFPAGAQTRQVTLDHEDAVHLAPDLSWWSDDRCVFVGDCKYKKTAGSVPNADLYQLLAYATALDLPEGLLLYAAGEGSPRELTVRHAGKRLHVRTVDISLGPEDVLSQIHSAAVAITAMAHEGRWVRA